MADNAMVEKFILARLPSTYSGLVLAADRHGHPDWDREIDKGLQRLRRRDVIFYQRMGRIVTWKRKEQPA